MLPEAHISHSTTRRFRVKIPSKKGDTTFFSHLKGILTRYEGIERLEINAVTGSVFFIHSMDSGKIVAYAESSGLFKIRSSSSHPTIFRPVRLGLGQFYY